jgi:hypothetical protein
VLEKVTWVGAMVGRVLGTVLGNRVGLRVAGWALQTEVPVLPTTPVVYRQEKREEVTSEYPS